MNFVIRMLASALGAGFLPKMPGTFGSLAALPLVWCFHDLSTGVFSITLTAFFSLSVPICHQAEFVFAKKDAPQIVLDEVMGMLVTFAFLPSLNLVSLGVGFGLFRLFDIFKPFPVRQFQDRLPGGWGVVMDDVMAGLYAHLLLRGFMWLF